MKKIFKLNGVRKEFNIEKKSEIVHIDFGDVSNEFSIQKVRQNELLFRIGNLNKIANVVREKDSIWVQIDGKTLHLEDITDSEEVLSGADGAKVDKVSAPMPGNVIKVLVNEGDKVVKGQTLVIVEAMKMENEVKSPSELEVDKVLVKVGQQVGFGEVLVSFKDVSEQ